MTTFLYFFYFIIFFIIFMTCVEKYALKDKITEEDLRKSLRENTIQEKQVPIDTEKAKKCLAFLSEKLDNMLKEKDYTGNIKIKPVLKDISDGFFVFYQDQNEYDIRKRNLKYLSFCYSAKSDIVMFEKAGLKHKFYCRSNSNRDPDSFSSFEIMEFYKKNNDRLISACNCSFEYIEKLLLQYQQISEDEFDSYFNNNTDPFFLYKNYEPYKHYFPYEDYKEEDARYARYVKKKLDDKISFCKTKKEYEYYNISNPNVFYLFEDNLNKILDN